MISRELVGFWLTTLLGLSALFGLFWKISRKVGKVSDAVEELPAMKAQIGDLGDKVGTVQGDLEHVRGELSLNSGRRTLRDLVQRIDVRTEALDQRLTDHITGGGHRA